MESKQIMAPLQLQILEKLLRAFSKMVVGFPGPFVIVQGRGKHRQKNAIYICSAAWPPEQFILSLHMDSTQSHL